MPNFEIQSIPKIAVLCNFRHTKIGVQIDLFETVICTLYTPKTSKLLPSAVINCV